MTEEPVVTPQTPTPPPPVAAQLPTDLSTPPVKPVYGVMDFQAQLVLPMSQNPPVLPIDGSVYIDTDDLRLYAFVSGAWRASRISALPGSGIVFTENQLGVTTISQKPMEVVNVTLESPWTVPQGELQPQRMRVASGAVQLRGQVQAPGPLGKIITILPSGWRPAVPMVAICVAGSGQQNIQIDPDGKVYPINGTGSPTRLGGIIFIADGN
jgi:hypothetical protein